MNETITRQAVVDRLLDDRSHHIEFNGHLTNHVKHAVIALAGLGAEPQLIQEFCSNYAERTPYGSGLEPARPLTHGFSLQDWREQLGQRVDWAGYCRFFDQLTRELGMAEVLQRFVPELLVGWVGAFTHAAIHLGWGLDVGNRWMIIEGLAYLAFAQVSCHPERASTALGAKLDMSVFHSLVHVARGWHAEPDEMVRWVESVIANHCPDKGRTLHPELVRSGLQFRIAKVCGVGHPLIYDLPPWIHRSDDAVWEELYYAVTLLYLALPGDFVALHYLTSLHAMEQIAACLPASARRHVLQCYWVGFLCMIFARLHMPEPSRLVALDRRFRDAFDRAGAAQEGAAWAETIPRAITEADEHNPKLVYVMERRWRRSGHRSVYRVAAGLFTTTPALPSSFDEPPHDQPSDHKVAS